MIRVTRKGRKCQRGRASGYELAFKLKVAADYFKGLDSLQQVGTRYGISRHLVHDWVKRFYDELSVQPRPEPDMTQAEKQALDELKKQNELLKKQLEHAEMKAHAWEIMVDVAEKQLGIDIKKKHGTKQQ